MKRVGWREIVLGMITLGLFIYGVTHRYRRLGCDGWGEYRRVGK